jgi:glucose dehydrogenase
MVSRKQWVIQEKNRYSILNKLKILDMKNLSLIIALGFFQISFAQNPIIQTKFTADPAPMVYKDTVFLYTSHDEDDALDSK